MKKSNLALALFVSATLSAVPMLSAHAATATPTPDHHGHMRGDQQRQGGGTRGTTEDYRASPRLGESDQERMNQPGTRRDMPRGTTGDMGTSEETMGDSGTSGAETGTTGTGGTSGLSGTTQGSGSRSGMGGGRSGMGAGGGQ